MDFHAESNGCIGDHNADRPEADDAELLSGYLRSRKLLLLFFRALLQVIGRFLVLQPLDSAHDVAGSQQHAGNDEFLDAVCIGTRRVEYHNALLRTGFDRNIVDACSGAGDGFQLVAEGHFLHICAADQDGV